MAGRLAARRGIDHASGDHRPRGGRAAITKAGRLDEQHVASLAIGPRPYLGNVRHEIVIGAYIGADAGDRRHAERTKRLFVLVGNAVDLAHRRAQSSFTQAIDHPRKNRGFADGRRTAEKNDFAHKRLTLVFRTPQDIRPMVHILQPSPHSSSIAARTFPVSPEWDEMVKKFH